MVLACTRFGRNPTSGGGDGAVNPRSASNSVVVGIDGSRASINAARWGVAEAVQRDVPLRLVHAVPASQCTTVSVQRDVGNADLALLCAEGAVNDAGKHVRVELARIVGHPVEVLMAESCRAVMMCIGEPTPNPSPGTLFGSTAAAPSGTSVLR